MAAVQRCFIDNLHSQLAREVKICGWIFRIRELAKTTFILVKDCTGVVQCVGSTDVLRAFRLRAEDAIEIRGSIREEPRAQHGYEVDILDVRVLNSAMQVPPFHERVFIVPDFRDQPAMEKSRSFFLCFGWPAIVHVRQLPPSGSSVLPMA